jgi:hypothetical protein
MTFSKVSISKYHNTVQYNTKTQSPNIADITNMHFIILKHSPKDKIFQQLTKH